VRAISGEGNQRREAFEGVARLGSFERGEQCAAQQHKRENDAGETWAFQESCKRGGKVGEVEGRVIHSKSVSALWRLYCHQRTLDPERLGAGAEPHVGEAREREFHRNSGRDGADAARGKGGEGRVERGVRVVVRL